MSGRRTSGPRLRSTAWGRSRCLTGLLLAVALLGLVGHGGPAGLAFAGETELARARTAYLATRDAPALLRALRREPQLADPIRLALATWAAGETTPAAPGSALIQAVAALRAGTLSPTRRLVAEAESRAPGVAATWLGALVRARSGDDAGAHGRLMAPPLFHWSEDAFDLALLGAALPAADRDVLAVAAQTALRRASRRARTPAVVSIALALVAFDPGRGPTAVARALRSLRRAGAFAEAEGLRASAGAGGVVLGEGSVAVESALTAWFSGSPEAAARLKALDPAKAPALRRLGPAPHRVAIPGPLPHREGPAVADLLLARLLRALGRSADEADVRAWRLQHAEGSSAATFPRRFLEARGLLTATVAGDDALAHRLIAAGLPVLLYRIVRSGNAYVERPVLIRGFDAGSDLWIADEPHMDRTGLVPHALARKVRLVAAVPAEHQALLSGVSSGPAGVMGARLEAALAEAEGGAAARAAEHLAADAPAPSSPVRDVYLAWLHAQRAIESGSRDDLLPAQPALARSMQTPPVLGFEHYAWGQAKFVSGQSAEALAAFEATERVEGPSATLALLRFAVHRAMGASVAAAADLDAALAQRPSDVRALYLRGSVRARAGNTAGARLDLRRALDRSPKSEPIAVALAELELDDGHPDAALGVLRALVRHAPRHAKSRRVRMLWPQAELGLMQRADSVDALRIFRRSIEPETRRALAFRLAGLQDLEAEALLRTMLADADEGVRVAVLRLYMRPWLRRRVEEDAVLLRTLSQKLSADPASNVRGAAAQVLGRVKRPVAAAALCSAVAGPERDADPGVRRSAARALAAQGPGRVLPSAVSGLEDPDEGVRGASIDSLFRLTGRRGGFEAGAPAVERAQAVEGWKRWLAEQRAAARPPKDGG